MKNNPALGMTWEEARNELFTKDEIAQSQSRVKIMSQLIEARNEKGISEKQLEEISGTNELNISEQIDNILQFLGKLDKTLIIVDKKQIF